MLKNQISLLRELQGNSRVTNTCKIPCERHLTIVWELDYSSSLIIQAEALLCNGNPFPKIFSIEKSDKTFKTIVSGLKRKRTIFNNRSKEQLCI